MTDPDFDAEQRRHLASTIEAADMMEESVRKSLQSGGLIPTKEFLKQLADQLQECQLVLEQHADGSVSVGREVLSDVATAMRAIHEALVAVAFVPPGRIQA